jgi:hypothetical protein
MVRGMISRFPPADRAIGHQKDHPAAVRLRNFPREVQIVAQ